MALVQRLCNGTAQRNRGGALWVLRVSDRRVHGSRDSTLASCCAHGHLVGIVAEYVLIRLRVEALKIDGIRDDPVETDGCFERVLTSTAEGVMVTAGSEGQQALGI